MPGWLWFLIQFLLIGGFFTYIILSSKKAIAEGKTTWFMKTWKKNLVAAAVLVTVCTGIYVNWLYTEQSTAKDLTDTIDFEKVLDFMARRAPKKDGISTRRNEKDFPEIMSVALVPAVNESETFSE